MITATQLVRPESRYGMRFSILLGDNGKLYAVRHESPYFCFEGDNQMELIEKAKRAIKFYYDRQRAVNG